MQSAAQLVAMLESSRAIFSAALKEAGESRAGARRAGEGWSVLQCAEPLAIVEDRFYRRFQAAPAEGATPDDPAKEADLAKRILDRVHKANAPEMVQPSGMFATLAEAEAAFHAARDRMIGYVNTTGEKLYTLAVEHPRFGKMNAAEMLVVLSGHTERHSEQIREILHG